MNQKCANCGEEIVPTFSRFAHVNEVECSEPIPLVEFDDPYMNMLMGL